LFDAIAGEFGGEGALTAMQREYISRAADHFRRAERSKSNNEIVRLTRCADQLISRVREVRRARSIAEPAGAELDIYLARKGTAA
jgi:hypothetical protein